jgi:hypothetical protein
MLSSNTTAITSRTWAARLLGGLIVLFACSLARAQSPIPTFQEDQSPPNLAKFPKQFSFELTETGITPTGGVIEHQPIHVSYQLCEGGEGLACAGNGRTIRYAQASRKTSESNGRREMYIRTGMLICVALLITTQPIGAAAEDRSNLVCTGTSVTKVGSQSFGLEYALDLPAMQVQVKRSASPSKPAGRQLTTEPSLETQDFYRRLI